MNYEEMKLARLRRSNLGKMLTDSDEKVKDWKRHFIKEKLKNKHWIPWLNLAARRGIINRFQQVELILSWEAKMTLTVESFELAKALFGLVAAMWFKAGRPWWAATNFQCAEFEVMFIQGFEKANPPPPESPDLPRSWVFG